MSAAAGDVTVVIPQWNRAELLADLLKHLRVQSYPIHKIVVVDNGSTDASVRVAEHGGAHVIQMGRNAGFAVAVNSGLRETASQWVALVNNDVTFGPQWLANLIERADASGAAFACGKLLRTGDPTNH